MKVFFNKATQCVVVENGLFIVIYSLNRGVFLERGPYELEKKALLEALSILEWELEIEAA